MKATEAIRAVKRIPLPKAGRVRAGGDWEPATSLPRRGNGGNTAIAWEAAKGSGVGEGERVLMWRGGMERDGPMARARIARGSLLVLLSDGFSFALGGEVFA